jgi:hypothetical protein
MDARGSDQADYTIGASESEIYDDRGSHHSGYPKNRGGAWSQALHSGFAALTQLLSVSA